MTLVRGGCHLEQGAAAEAEDLPAVRPEVNPGQLPSPLDRLQALSMGKAADLKLLFQGLIDQFGFGRIGYALSLIRSRGRFSYAT